MQRKSLPPPIMIKPEPLSEEEANQKRPCVEVLDEKEDSNDEEEDESEESEDENQTSIEGN